jgi:uncharacterized protein YndB with AHSA1/START domain
LSVYTPAFVAGGNAANPALFVRLCIKKIKSTAMSTEATARTQITVSTVVNAPVSTVWDRWNKPEHITQWCQASDDWHAPKADNDLRVGGSFSTTMAAKDGSFSFDFGGIYDAVTEHKQIAYTMSDGRKVNIVFEEDGNTTKVTETFDAETMNPVDMQQAGWQAILDNFKKYTEANS